jgi:phage regulator Rha-like protein
MEGRWGVLEVSSRQLETSSDSIPGMGITREIAELTGKEHKHVMRDFRDMCEALEIVESNFGRNYIASNGKGNPEYLLPKDLTTTRAGCNLVHIVFYCRSRNSC